MSGRDEAQKRYADKNRPYYKNRNKEWYKNNKEYVLRRNKERILLRMGLTLEMHEQEVIRAAGKCMCCADPLDRINTDHDHETGFYRGILCTRCNFTLGLVKDDIDTLYKLIQYLTERQGKIT